MKEKYISFVPTHSRGTNHSEIRLFSFGGMGFFLSPLLVFADAKMGALRPKRNSVSKPRIGLRHLFHQQITINLLLILNKVYCHTDLFRTNVLHFVMSGGRFF